MKAQQRLVARHEAAHVVLGIRIGWHLERVHLYRHKRLWAGNAHWNNPPTPPAATAEEGLQRALDGVAAALAGDLAAAWTSSVGDHAWALRIATWAVGPDDAERFLEVGEGRARVLLAEYAPAIGRLTQALVDRGSLTGDQVLALLA